MAITNGYATLQNFKDFADVDSTDTNDDAVLESIIESVSRYIDKETGLIFYDLDPGTRYYTAELSDFLRLDLPLRTVTTLKTDDGGDGTFEVTWETTDYHLKPFNDDQKFWIELNPNGNNAFPVGIAKGVEIIGAWGYSSVPTDIYTTCLEIAKNVEGRRHGQGTESADLTAAGVIVTPRDIGPYPRSVLNKYRRNR